MKKYHIIKTHLVKLPPTYRALAVKHFNELWESYFRRTSYPRYLYSQRLISLTHFRRLVKQDEIALDRELQGRVRALATLAKGCKYGL